MALEIPAIFAISLSVSIVSILTCFKSLILTLSKPNLSNVVQVGFKKLSSSFVALSILLTVTTFEMFSFPLSERYT